MKKAVCLAAILSLCSLISNSQNADSVIITGEAYVPVEGRGETPGKLEGTWILKSGLKPNNREKAKEFFEKKPAPGTVLNTTSSTTTNVKNGVTTTSTETQVEKVLEVEPGITPPQGSKMHKPKPPSLNFYGKNHTFSGFTGCNKIAGRYTATGNKLTINAANPSTKMTCIGDYDEQDFLDKLKRVNSYRVSNDGLELLGNGDVLLVFARK